MGWAKQGWSPICKRNRREPNAGLQLFIAFPISRNPFSI
jgi:hypothetical protein